MAVQTKTFYPEPPYASFTATIATASGTNDAFMNIIGPSFSGQAGYQAEYILQSAGVYRWLQDAPIRSGASAITAYAYRLLGDSIPQYST